MRLSAFQILLLGLAAPTLAANCTREGLLAAAEKFLAAVTAGSTEGLPLSPKFSYMENNRASDLKRSSYLTSPLKIDLSRSTADTVACASYTMFISASGSKPWVVSTQIRHPESGDTSTIELIDSIAATTGSLFFNAQRTLTLIKAQDWSPIADPAKRPPRDLLKRYGDGYLDMWTDANAAGSMEWGDTCERVEGSQHTKPCGVTLPRGGSTTKNGNRRYVIDEVMGSVDVLCSFDSLPPWGPDSHELRVEFQNVTKTTDGVKTTKEAFAVKYVHTVTLQNPR